MQKLSLNEIRKKYLIFFENKEHLVLPSFSLIPKDDVSLFLINAGMAPLKSYFTREKTPPSKRVTTCQKCIRTSDIERVGKTARHGTFFEMLGNFSFGDYFKEEACRWAWQFVTEVLSIPVERIWISIYEKDEQAFDIWANILKTDASHIVRLGKEDNFWEIGVGPCGPCSELYYDRGVEYGCGRAECAPGCDCDRFTEFWNLVFTQFDKQHDGSYLELKNANIDTGMGLERIACIMQGVNSLFEIDTIQATLNMVCELSQVKYGVDEKRDLSLRIITDHIRSAVFMIGDGILPSNEGRQYVLRRLLRRAARHGKLLCINQPFLFLLAQSVIDNYQNTYPELINNSTFIKNVIKSEEDKFLQTIDQGLHLLKRHIALLKEQFGADSKTNQKIQIDGDFIFKLYDTYGFPADLTIEIAAESNCDIDLTKFEQLMMQQQENARDARRDLHDKAWISDNVFDKIKPTSFEGYEVTECRATVVAIVKNGELVLSATSAENINVVLDKTPFYAESGGQIGDSGVIKNDTFVLEVTDTQKYGSVFAHKGTINQGKVSVGDMCLASVDASRRKAVERNHSVVHLIQRALKNLLGEHVAQMGSFVSEDKFRFDFSHFSAISLEQLNVVENKVNDVILQNLSVNFFYKDLESAHKLGAIALFDEKYGSTVRIVQMGDYSVEFCGGTHVRATGEIGLCKIVNESGLGANVRRIEGVTGFNLLDLVRKYELTINDVSGALKTTSAEVVFKAQSMTKEIKRMSSEVDKLNKRIANLSSCDISSKAIEINGISLFAAKLDDGLDVKAIRALGDSIKNQYNKVLIVLASVCEERVNWVAMANKGAVELGVNAGLIISRAAEITGGRGGGRLDSAQGGGNEPTKVDEALKFVKTLVADLTVSI